MINLNTIDSMNTIHIIGSKTLGGAERFFLRLTQAIHDSGNHTTLFLRKNSEVIPQVAPGPAVELFNMSSVWDIFSMFAIKKRLKALHPQVVQTYMGRATRLTHLPKKLEAIHISRLGGYYKLDGYRHADAWIGNTKALCDYLVKGGLPGSRVFYMPNFVDMPIKKDETLIDSLKKTFNIPKDSLNILTAGRFIEVKGQRYLVEAFARLKPEINSRPVCLVLLGDGPLDAQLKAMAKELGVSERVFFTGWQTEPGHFYHMADMVAFPSLEGEALGNVILEAWAYGKPVVASSFPGAMELISDEEDGFRVPCRDTSHLANRLQQLCENQQLANRMAENGRNKVESSFSRAIVVKNYLELYAKLLKDKTGV